MKLVITFLFAVMLSACGGSDQAAQSSSAITPAALAAAPAPVKRAFEPLQAAQDNNSRFLRLFQAFYGVAPSNATLNGYSALAADGGVSLSNQFAADFSGTSDTALAKLVLDNISINATSVNSASYQALLDAVGQIFAAFGQGSRGRVVLNLVNLLADLESEATYGQAAQAFNSQVSANLGYSSSASNTSARVVRTAAWQAAYNACYNGTPALYTTSYCTAYASARAVGASASVANQLGATAANSNVGNIGTGETVSATGTPRTGTTGTTSATQSYQDAYAACYNGTPALYNEAYCNAYAASRAAGNSAAAANQAGADAAASNVGNVGMGGTLSATGTPRTGTTGGTGSGGTGTGTSGTTVPAPAPINSARTISMGTTVPISGAGTEFFAIQLSAGVLYSFDSGTPQPPSVVSFAWNVYNARGTLLNVGRDLVNHFGWTPPSTGMYYIQPGLGTALTIRSHGNATTNPYTTANTGFTAGEPDWLSGSVLHTLQPGRVATPAFPINLHVGVTYDIRFKYSGNVPGELTLSSGSGQVLSRTANVGSRTEFTQRVTVPTSDTYYVQFRIPRANPGSAFFAQLSYLPDADGDGDPDETDPYPNDPTRSSTTGGTGTGGTGGTTGGTCGEAYNGPRDNPLDDPQAHVYCQLAYSHYCSGQTVNQARTCTLLTGVLSAYGSRQTAAQYCSAYCR